MSCAAAKLVQEWDFAAPSGCACQAAAVTARAGQVELGTCLTSLGPVVEVAAVLLPPAPFNTLDLTFS